MEGGTLAAALARDQRAAATLTGGPALRYRGWVLPGATRPNAKSIIRGDEMKVRASWRALALALLPLAFVAGACKRKPVEVNDLTPSVSFSRSRAPLGSAVEVAYRWTTGPNFKPLQPDYKAVAHFL